VAPLEFVFYEASQFPSRYRHGAFIAEHGSWNRSQRSGYQVVFVPFENGNPTAPASPFFTRFVPDPNGREVYGRPVGVAVTPDGSLLISDDGSRLIWRVSSLRAGSESPRRPSRRRSSPIAQHRSS
jgi:glucose/arabinose dehydrogenase